MTTCLIAAMVSVSLLHVESPNGLADVELAAPIHRDEVRQVRPWIRECVGLLFVLPIGPGQSSAVLSQVLFPLGDHEQLHKTPRRFAVTKQTPPGCACPQPRQAYMLHGLNEPPLIFGRNGIGIAHEHGP